jgi:hypothetical protein
LKYRSQLRFERLAWRAAGAVGRFVFVLALAAKVGFWLVDVPRRKG